MERFKRGIGIADDPDSVSVQPKYVDNCHSDVCVFICYTS